ncbi:MAG: glycosyltransferase family 9 protein [Gammaproteobacteria bacterium]
MAELCPWIDSVLIDTHEPSLIKDLIHLSKKIRTANVDASISLYSEMRTSLALWLASVNQRFGPATKLAQIFINRRLRQKRSRSAKPEFEYNLDLVRYFIQMQGDRSGSLQGPPYLSFDANDVHNTKAEYYKSHNIETNRKLVFIHPGSGGSAINLTLQQYTDLATTLAEKIKLHFVITAGPDELETATRLATLMQHLDCSVYHSQKGLVAFSRFIASCDLFISGSTGPLHIAGALDVNTAAFYPARRSATPLRWQTLNQQNRRLAFAPDRHVDENDMQTINLQYCAETITNFLINKPGSDENSDTQTQQS